MERDVASVYVPQYSFSINSFGHETNIIIGWSTSSCQLFHSIGITSIPSFLGVQSVPLVCSMKIQFMANFSSSFVLITSDPIKFKFSNSLSLSLCRNVIFLEYISSSINISSKRRENYAVSCWPAYKIPKLNWRKTRSLTRHRWWWSNRFQFFFFKLL